MDLEKKRGRIINSGAICPDCKTKSINYGINGGSYVYTCLECDAIIPADKLLRDKANI
jgi:hypothetical protein